MTWKMIALGDGPSSVSTASRLQDEFADLFMSAGAPPEVVMYGGKEESDWNNYYFTPTASVLADTLLGAYGAVDCQPPKIANLVVMVMNSGAPVPLP
jgi:hypothetical protein